MDWTICSRETERDYTWDNSHASHLVAEYAQGLFAPGFEGSLTTSRFAALLRCPGSPQGVILCVSVSTTRKDFRSRPIRTMVVLRAENPDEEELIVAFFAEGLRKSDTETLYDATSGVAKAVESLYQTKKPDDFLRFCRSLPAANGSGEKPTGRYGIPRGDASSRQKMAKSLPALIGDGKPFLIALTDRTPSDVIASLGTMVDRGVVRIFSKATTTVEKLPEPAPQKYARAATIGGVVVLSILFVAAIGPCCRGGGNGEAVCATNTVDRTESGGAHLGNGGTNAPPSKGVAETTAQTGGRGDGTNTPPSRIEIGGTVSKYHHPLGSDGNGE